MNHFRILCIFLLIKTCLLLKKSNVVKIIFIFDIIYFTASLDTRTLLDYDTLNNLPSDLSNQLRDIMDQSHLAISFTTNLKVKNLMPMKFYK